MLKSPTEQRVRYRKLQMKIWNKQYRETHQKEIKAWDRSHSAYYTEKRKGWRERAGKHNSEYVQEWYAKHPKIRKVNVKMIGLREKLPLADFCEVCPPDDLRGATQRHHPDYDFPLIYVSCCNSCHTHMNLERSSDNSGKEQKP